MTKLKKLIKIRENSFEGGVGGTTGTVNYQTPLNTPNYGVQDPSKFHSSNANKAVGQHSNTLKDVPDSEDFDAMLDKIYKGKNPPTADQVQAALDYELHNMIKPDLEKAKEIVLQNLTQDSQYYGKLHFLNIDDKSMKIDVQETKKIFAELAVKKDKKYVVNDKLVDVMKEMWQQKQESRKFVTDFYTDKKH